MTQLYKQTCRWFAVLGLAWVVGLGASAARADDDDLDLSPREYESKHCGDFRVEIGAGGELPAESQISTRVTRARPPKSKDFETEEFETTLVPSRAVWERFHSTRFIMDGVFLEDLKRRVQKRFDADLGAAAAMGEPALIDEEWKATYDVIHQQVMDAFADRPAKQIRMLLLLYPGLEDELKAAQGSRYLPLLCRYQLREHRARTLKKIARNFNYVAAGVSIVALKAPAVTAIPMVAIGIGVLDAAAGGLRLTEVALNWQKVRAGKIAKRMIELQEKIQIEYQRLKSLETQALADPSVMTDADRRKLEFLSDHLMEEARLAQVKDIAANRKEHVIDALSAFSPLVQGVAAVKAGFDLLTIIHDVTGTHDDP